MSERKLVGTGEMFKKALAGGYAIGAYNVNNMEILQGIAEAAEETQSPIILQVSAGARKYANQTYLIKLVEAALATTTVPIALHLDHGADFEICKACIDGGFSSVMIDGSRFPLEENIALTKKVVEYAHAHGVSVEAELGKLAGVEDDVKVHAKDSTYELISNSSTSLVPMRLIYGQDLNYQPSSQIYTVNRRQPGEIRPEEVKFIGVSTALSNMNMPLAANDESYQVSVSDGETYKGYGISSGRNRSLSIRETPEMSPASYFWRYFGDCRIYDDRGTDIGSNIHSNDWYYYYYLPGHCEPQDVVKSVIYG